ncbi:acetolactate synthase-1/3 small subunit [Candidatus Fervidibacter sacchari]|uniref:Acetolactate synthase small subunit n=2 Tax=Candidatus Fervidibacter sacchari TaxID=1448929 RepID=A0ABT2END8_9BACT|nr:acetolactate synthase-1/3 small subunit [Candidatus Fervidibacter sacchari]
MVFCVLRKTEGLRRDLKTMPSENGRRQGHRLHTLSVLVENRPGVLARIAGLFARRGYNIESLAVSTTDDPKTSRMTIVVGGDDDTIEQITKQLNKLIDVIKVQDHTGEDVVERELALVKVNCELEQRPHVIQLVEIFRASIVDVGADTMTVEITGSSDKIDALIELLRPFGIREVVRTGKIILERGSKSL